MTVRSILAALAVSGLLAWGFVAMAPEAPGVWVLVLTAATFGAGPAYGSPHDGVVDLPWRRLTRTRALARRLGVRRLGVELDRAGWNRQVRRPIRSRANVRELRRVAVGALLSHGTSALMHVGGAVALTTTSRPGWALAALVLGGLVHAWPALLQVELLARVDELRALAARRR